MWRTSVTAWTARRQCRRRPWELAERRPAAARHALRISQQIPRIGSHTPALRHPADRPDADPRPPMSLLEAPGVRAVALARRPGPTARRPVAAPPRRRPARQRPVVVDVLAAAAGLGLGVTIGLAVDRRERRLAQRAGRDRHRARPPGRAARRLRDGRRRAARRARAAAGARDRPGPARRLAPQARPVAAVPAARPRRADHRRLRPAGARRRAAPVRAAAVDLPRHPGRDRRLAPAVRRRHHLLPARAPAHGLRDVVVGAPLHLPRAVPVVLAPGRHGRVVRRASRRALLVDGAVARDARAWSSPRASGCRCGARCATGCGSSASRRRARASCRSSCAAGASTGCRSPAASSCSGASCAAGCGGRRTRTRCRRRRRATSCASPSRTSATTAPALARAARPGTRVAIEGPYGAFTADTRRARPAAARRRRASAPRPILALLQELPPEADVIVLLRALDARADLVLRDEVADEVRRRGGRLRRARRLARRGAPRRRRAAPDRPRRAPPRASTSAAPTRSRGSSPPSSSAPASPERRIHFESFTF